MAKRGPKARWVPPLAKERLEQKLEEGGFNGVSDFCYANDIPPTSIKSIYRDRPAGIRNAVRWLELLGFDQNDPAMAVLMEMAGQNLAETRKIVPVDPTTNPEDFYGKP